MSIPEDIPEDKAESVPCPGCEDGNVVIKGNRYGCDKCTFEGWSVTNEK